jgi:hypothetical protein
MTCAKRRGSITFAKCLCCGICRGIVLILSSIALFIWASVKRPVDSPERRTDFNCVNASFKANAGGS